MSRYKTNEQLFNELKRNLEKDKLYWIQNDAKVRAVITSKNYDEFKDYVAAAHLQPLTKKEINKKHCNSWNKVTDGQK